jgi:hypothetical protein
MQGKRKRVKMNSGRPSAAIRAAAMLSLCAAVIGIAAAADDAFVCMEQSQQKCDDENRNLDLFIKGRDAFEKGREAGDLGEAHRLARELMDRKDDKHGKGLMKFIYLQVMQGGHKDLVEAYRWVQGDIDAGVSYPRLDLTRIRDALAGKMTPEQLSEARK